ncbi:MAG: hypothetical protein V1895_02810 [Parcubacteria group bacterium]
MAQINVRVIVTHVKPHLDEYAALWFLRKFGDRVFPGVSRAVIQYWNAGRATPDGRSAAAWEADGYLLLAVGGSRFDEHPDENGVRPSNECCTTLVCRALGLDKSPVFERFINYVRANDVDGSSNYMDVARTIKALHKTHSPEEVMRIAFVIFDAFLGQEASFHGKTAMEYRNNAQVFKVMVGERELTIVTGRTDDPLFSKYARSSHGDQAAVVVQKKGNGQIMVLSDKRYELDLREVAKVVRLSEQQARHRVLTRHWATLEQEGSVPGAEMWHFDARLQCLLNGSESAPDAEPTKLSLFEIRRAVEIGLDSKRFCPDFERTTCKKGLCVGRQCRWFDLGLNRCQAIRKEMRRIPAVPSETAMTAVAAVA